LKLAVCIAVACIAIPCAAQTQRIIDTHAHPFRGDAHVSMGTLAEQALGTMDEFGVDATIFLPPPYPPGQRRMYGRRELESLARSQPARLSFAAGAETLNVMIQATPPDRVTPGIVRDFQGRLVDILPPEVAPLIARENAKKIYRLDRAP
jgi:hypothetical protein